MKIIIILLSLSLSSCLGIDNSIRGYITGTSTQPSPLTLFYSVSDYFLKNEALTPILPGISEIGNFSYSITPNLPTGMNFDSNTGIISGTPTSTNLSTNYTIEVTDGDRQATTNVSFGVGQKFLVNSTADSNDTNIGDGICDVGGSLCTLRAAVDEINNLPKYKIVVEIPASTTITLTNDRLELTADSIVEIRGGGAGSTIITTPGVSQTRIFHVEASVDSFTIRAVSLNGGGDDAYSGSGGAVYSLADVNYFEDCEMDNNENPSALATEGSAIYALNATNIDACSFTGNTAYKNGGAISVAGSLVINNSTFSNNFTDAKGGAIYATGSSLMITSSSFILNQADEGGAVLATNTASVEIESSVFDSNLADGSGFERGGALHLSNSGTPVIAIINKTNFKDNVAADEGGSIFVRCAGDCEVYLTNSTISGSDSLVNVGGGLMVYSLSSTDWLYITNTTFAENDDAQLAVTEFNVSLNHTTFLSGGGTGASIMLGSSNTFNIKNSILGHNGANCFDAATSTFTSLGNNLELGDSCSLDGTGSNGDLINTDPLFVGGLADNGGPTPTVLVNSTTSPALDKIPVSSCASSDQREYVRPVDKVAGPLCDIGAVEIQ